MFPTLFAVVVALVLGHMAPSLAAGLRDYGWYRALLAWLGRRFAGDGFWAGRGGLLMALVPVLLVVGFVQWLLDGVAYGLPALLFGVAMVFYAWGPRDLDIDVEAVLDAPDAATRRETLARLRPVAADAAHDGQDAVGRVFVAALRRWFGVLFWFVLLGAVGALLYRLVVIAAEDEAALQLPEGTVDGARRLLALLDWPVAQFMALSLALVGNFDVVATAWKASADGPPRAAAAMLAAVGRASVHGEPRDDADDAPAGGATGLLPEGDAAAALLQSVRAAMSLVWRVLLAWLAVLALFVVAGWVG